jgi:putative phage-type endonuclease
MDRRVARKEAKEVSSIKIANESHWHELRKKHVGASESAALFGLLPWITPWQLHMQKSGKLDAPDLDSVKHISAGKHFEPAVAGWASQKFGITLNKVRRYLIDDECNGMGASLDFEQTGTGERIPTELKWVVRTDDAWEYEGDTIVQAPEYYLIQIQHQLACAGANRGQLIAFINGDVRRAVYERRPGVIKALRERIAEFWADIEAGREPAIDFKADAEAVMRYASKVGHHTVEWTPEIATLAQAAFDKAAERKAAEDACDAAKAELTMKMIEAATLAGMNDPEAQVKVEADGFRLTNTFVGAYAGREVTQDMVGTHIGARGAFRKLTVSRPKPKKSKKESAET